MEFREAKFHLCVTLYYDSLSHHDKGENNFIERSFQEASNMVSLALLRFEARIILHMQPEGMRSPLKDLTALSLRERQPAVHINREHLPRL